MKTVHPRLLHFIFIVAASLFLNSITIQLADAATPDRQGTGTVLKGFRESRNFQEQEMTFRLEPDVRIHINAPSPAEFNPSKYVRLVLYALPNGNTIEQTAGIVVTPDDDWHFDIQHIAAQTRFLRRQATDCNIVTAYLETDQKSWPTWRKDTPDYSARIADIVDSLMTIFAEYNPRLVLGGHSGGGRFIFGYLSSRESIPDEVERISFLDSDYGYEDSYGKQLADWLKSADPRYLSVIAYNDSIALYKGKPFVSATGGTWYRSKMMKNYLATHFTFETSEDSAFIRHTALNGRIQFILKKNPERKILHTVQVERNGFIQGMLSGTELDEENYVYYGSRIYSDLIGGVMPDLRLMSIPVRPDDAITGSAFMEKVKDMTFEEREKEIFAELTKGNLPGFLRETKKLTNEFKDAAGETHTVIYETMPDYLAIGSDDDFVRMPMGPKTAQKVADLFHCSLPTRKIVDDIYKHAGIKLYPTTFYPVSHSNEHVPKFVAHNSAIGILMRDAGGLPGDLVAGIKKDIVISNRIIEPKRPGHVIIYGWHKPDGKNIQPLTNVHNGEYTDYSHGVRLINSEVLVDGVPMQISDVLKNPLLFTLLSDEYGVMSVSRYDTGSD